MTGPGGVTGIIARTGTVTADTATIGTAVTADVMTDGGDIIVIADTITNFGGHLQGRPQCRPCHLRLR